MEDFLDFLSSLYDDAVDVLSSFWDSFTEWVSDVWNWLRNFFYEVYESIVSWFNELGNWAENQLKKLSHNGHIIFTDPISPTGKKIKELVGEIPPMSLEQFRAMGASQKVAQYKDAEINGLTMDGDQIMNLAAFDAKTVQNPNEFRQVMEEHDGIISISA